MTPTTEKAAPIPAEVLAPFQRMAECTEHTDVRDGDIVMRLQHPETKEWVVLTRADFRAIMQDRASQEERIREDERDRLFEEFTSAFTEEVYQIRGAAMWAGEVIRRKGAMLPAERARLRGGSS